jgi:phage baseplate assembly protein W
MPDTTTLRGLAFPFRIDGRTGGVAVTEGGDKLKENLKHLLLTRTGERLMLRDYGGGVDQLLHANINDGLIALARHQITRAIVQFEPRVLPEDVSVVPDNAQLYLRVRYLQADAQRLQTMVIPLR